MKYLLAVISLVLLSTQIDARNSKNVEYISLAKDFNNLIENEKYKPYAKKEKLAAQSSVNNLVNGKVKSRKKELALYLSRHKIAYARLVAEYNPDDQIKSRRWRLSQRLFTRENM